MEQVKTLLLGMLIAVVLMMLVGAGNSTGRYQIAGAGGSVFYVLDTDTGKIIAAGGVYSPSSTHTRFADDAVADEKRY